MIKRLFINASLVAFSIVSCFFLAEITCRLILEPAQLVEVSDVKIKSENPQPLSDLAQDKGIDVVFKYHHRGVRLVPNIKAKIHNHALSRRNVVIQTNSLGLRHNEELGPKGKDEYRILVMGDSITFGDYLSNDETITSQMESLLADRRKKITVINAGLPGSSSFDEFHHYLEIKDAVDADLVLVAMYLNDSQNSKNFYAKSVDPRIAKSAFLSLLANRVKLFNEEWLKPVSVTDGIKSNWREDFQGNRTLKSGHMFEERDAFDYEIYNAHNDFGLAWNPKSWDNLSEIMKVFSLAAQESGSEFAVFLLPVHMQVYSKSIIQNQVANIGFDGMCKDLGLVCHKTRDALRVAYLENDKKSLFLYKSMDR